MKVFIKTIWGIIRKIIYYFVSNFLKLIKRPPLSDDQWNSLFRFIKFCFVGVSNTAISLGIYYLVVLWNYELYFWGNVLGFAASVTNSYYWNSNYVFNKKDERAKTFIKTVLAYSSNLIIGSVLLVLFVEKIGISAFIAPVLCLLITIPFNFFLNKFWVMK